MTATMQRITADELNAYAEFDCPFESDGQGNVSSRHDVWAPDVFHDDSDDMLIDGIPYDQHPTWEAFSRGYTGQYGYHGPVMHASEYLGGRLAQDVLDTPGVYVVVAVECDPEWREASHSELQDWKVGYVGGDDYRETERGLEVFDPEPFPAGWALLRMEA